MSLSLVAPSKRQAAVVLVILSGAGFWSADRYSDSMATQDAPCPAGSRCVAVDATGHANPAGGYIAQCTDRFPDSVDLVPPDYAGRRFLLSQSYPQTVPAQTFPWLAVDFTTASGALQYLALIRSYVYDGMQNADWRLEDNTVRRWYHIPWMTAGRHPREFVRGLTEERPLTGPELGIKPGRSVANWAVGSYNDVGAVAIGRVWANAAAPNATAAQSAEGTVVFKILFSAATADDFSGDDPLAGAVEWQANIVAQRNPLKKAIRPVRLLQMDVAMRDHRAPQTGWVFGTFAYDRNAQGANGWEKMVPVGLMWGNDPTLSPATFAAGQRATQTLANAAAPAYAASHLGWLGRLNGPVDNPLSSCLSCHSTAQFPAIASILPLPNCSNTQKMRWFRSLKGSTPFGAVGQQTCQPTPNVASTPLDYSLQESVGLQNAADATLANPCQASPGPPIAHPAAAGARGPAGRKAPTVYPVERK